MIIKCLKIISYAAITVIPIILTYSLKNRYKKIINKYTSSDSNSYKLIFISIKNFECLQHFYHKTACCENCSYYYLITIVRFLENAKQTINLCMCMLTCNEIHDALVRAHNRGVKVQFLSDAEMLRNEYSRALFLKEAGVSIKIQPGNDRGIVHHKFCVVDEASHVDANMFFGTLNLTCQGLTANWDVTMFTNNRAIIERFHEEFEYLWNNFEYF